jgi:transcription initiation factor TFIID subunit 1
METLTDPFVIQAYLKERRAFDIKTRRRAQMAAAAAAKAASRPPRPAKAPKPGKAVVPRAAQPAAAAAAAKKSVQVRCGTCGAVGHMRTNRVCPLYAEYEASIARDAEPVRVDGTKLTISKQSLSAALKRKADRTPVAVVAARKERAQAPPLTFGQQRALGEMSLLLQDILARLAGMQASWPFRKPVSRKDYPHYFALVAKPLDLGTVKARARKLAYRSPAAFLADVRLIRDNCVQFNGPDHPFSAMAGEIVARAEEAVGEHAERFGQWAALLDAPVTGGDELAAAEGGEHAAAEDGEHEPHDQDGGGGGGEEDSHHEMIVDV